MRGVKAILCACALGGGAAAGRRSPRAEHPSPDGPGFVGRGAARRDGGSRQPGTHPEGPNRITDSDGVYRITELLPGTYTVTFTLQGFKSQSSRKTSS